MVYAHDYDPGGPGGGWDDWNTDINTNVVSNQGNAGQTIWLTYTVGNGFTHSDYQLGYISTVTFKSKTSWDPGYYHHYKVEVAIAGSKTSYSGRFYPDENWKSFSVTIGRYGNFYDSVQVWV
ncbi:MAG: hypothetical protein GF308_10640 [Candidatus Heimdallarchaeota archaeon]|nr:hypothetical protein [Candidatus Heimdallarchaeota archaeon]